MQEKASQSTAPHPAMRSVNPATGEVLGEFRQQSAEEVEAAIGRAGAAFGRLKGAGFGQRSAWMESLAERLVAERGALARTMSLEMGKPVRAAAQEVDKCAGACRFYAARAEGMLREQAADESGLRYVRYEPLGPVLAVMPWNFPLWQVFRFAAPALMAGNPGLLKHASNVPQCALAIARLIDEAGFPAGSFETLLIGSDRVAGVIGDARVAAVTLTGSVGAGAEVAAAAGRAIKKTVLELGGSDPFVVMPSANLDLAARTAVMARVINNGQSCIAAKRFFVHESVADAFLERFVAEMAALRVGDPLQESTDVGPLATAGVLRDLTGQVDRTVALGARVLLGGKRLAGPGNYYAPTVLVDVPLGSPAFREELFGPVAPVFRVRDVGEAIRLANDTEFGLGACIWTQDGRERERYIREIEAGMVFVNGMVASDARVPFGGIKQSGYGRELGDLGIREFVNAKSVCLADGG